MFRPGKGTTAKVNRCSWSNRVKRTWGKDCSCGKRRKKYEQVPDKNLERTQTRQKFANLTSPVFLHTFSSSHSLPTSHRQQKDHRFPRAHHQRLWLRGRLCRLLGAGLRRLGWVRHGWGRFLSLAICIYIEYINDTCVTFSFQLGFAGLCCICHADGIPFFFEEHMETSNITGNLLRYYFSAVLLFAWGAATVSRPFWCVCGCLHRFSLQSIWDTYTMCCDQANSKYDLICDLHCLGRFGLIS